MGLAASAGLGGGCTFVGESAFFGQFGVGHDALAVERADQQVADEAGLCKPAFARPA
jgi:hypothetical protein